MQDLDRKIWVNLKLPLRSYSGQVIPRHSLQGDNRAKRLKAVTKPLKASS